MEIKHILITELSTVIASVKAFFLATLVTFTEIVMFKKICQRI
jgi:hypothetical protein